MSIFILFSPYQISEAPGKIKYTVEVTKLYHLAQSQAYVLKMPM